MRRVVLRKTGRYRGWGGDVRGVGGVAAWTAWRRGGVAA